MIKERRFDLDFIRVFSCLCVLIIHFNAALSEWNNGVFVYPNAVFPNYLFRSVYLGGLGVSMFIMLSGATLSIAHPKGCGKCFKDLLNFYKKRFYAIYPMFWIAWFAFLSYNLLTYKTMNGAPLWHIIFSVCGVDGYMNGLGIGNGEFYQVGEWFLGCIILLYAIYPVLDYSIRKRPIVLTLLVLIIYIILNNILKISNINFLLHIPEMLLGMIFVRYLTVRSLRGRLSGMLIVFIIGTVSYRYSEYITDYFGELTYQIVISACVFVFLAYLAPIVKSFRLRNVFMSISKYTYAIFLVHHQIIYIMVNGFDLSNMPKRVLYTLFISYLIITGIVAVLLFKTVDLFIIASRKRRL